MGTKIEVGQDSSQKLGQNSLYIPCKCSQQPKKKPSYPPTAYGGR